MVIHFSIIQYRYYVKVDGDATNFRCSKMPYETKYRMTTNTASHTLPEPFGRPVNILIGSFVALMPGICGLSLMTNESPWYD